MASLALPTVHPIGINILVEPNVSGRIYATVGRSTAEETVWRNGGGTVAATVWRSLGR
jgi:hypothetical protein